MSRSFALCAALVLALALPAAARAADPASLDIGFGDGGRVRLGGPGDPLAVDALAVGPGPSIVAAGAAGGGYIAARFQASGLPDLGFGTNGIARFAYGADRTGPVAALPDGRVLLIPGAESVQRLLPDGRPDPAFGDGGMVHLLLWSAVLIGLVGEADGAAVVLAGNHALKRFKPDGTLDETSGEVYVPGAGVAVALLARPTGGFIVVSDSSVREAGRAVLTALDADRQPDPSFGRDGSVTVFGVTPEDAAIAPNGTIAVAGEGVCGEVATAPRCPEVRLVSPRGRVTIPDGLELADRVAFDARGRLLAVEARTGSTGRRHPALHARRRP